MKPNLSITICIFFLFLSTTFGQKSKTKKSKFIEEVSLDAFQLRKAIYLMIFLFFYHCLDCH